MAFTTGDMAYFFDNTKGAIRFYEEKGLLEPERTAAGHRSYSVNDLFQLFYLRRFADFGCSIQEIANNFRSDNSNSVADVEFFLECKEDQLEKRIRELQMMKYFLEEQRGSIAKFVENPEAAYEESTNGYYYLNEDYLSQMGREEKEIVRQWILATPMTHVHLEIRKDEHQEWQAKKGFGIHKDHAEILGLPIPKDAIVEAPSELVCSVIRSHGQDFQTNFTDQIEDCIRRVRQCGYEVEEPGDMTLLFSNRCGKTPEKYFKVIFQKK